MYSERVKVHLYYTTVMQFEQWVTIKLEPEVILLTIMANLDRVSDSDEEDGGTDPSTKSEVCWGLSRSSCNLAKELLTAQQLSVAESEENFLQLTKLESKSSQEKDDKDEDKPADVSIAMFAQLDPFPSNHSI